MKQDETKFKEKVQTDLDKLPKTEYMKTQERGRKGVPDMFVCINGQMVVMELKIPGEELEPLQEVTLNRWEKSGAMAFRTDSELWPYHYEVLKELANRVLFVES